jgi:hypothetical protein
MAISTRRRGNPLVASYDANQTLAENILTRSPSKTRWAEEMLQGASQYELQMIEPVSEDDLKRFFPKANAVAMKDPLKLDDKQRIHDNIRRDPGTSIALFTYCYFMLGPDSSITMGLGRKYATEERKKDQMDVIMNNAEYLDILEDIMNRDDEMNIQDAKFNIVCQASAFGRSVALKKLDKRQLPCKLIPLSSTRLGRVWIDRDNWDFLGVEYLDYTKDKRILLAKDIIHYENNDMLITPRSRFYGMSMLEPLMSIGERNRVINDIAIPEITRKHWAPVLLVKVNTGSQTKLNQIRDIFSMPGKTQIYNDDIEVTQVTLNHDLDKLQTCLENGNQDIFRGCTVPQGIGWSYDPNHATMENSLLAWYNGVIAFKRANLDAVLWLQFYKPQLETIWNERTVNKIPETNGLVDYLVQNAAVIQGEKPELPFRITTEFKNIKTTGFLELASALLGFQSAGIINDEIALKESGLEQYIDDMAEEKANQVTLGNNLLAQEQAMMMQGQGQQGQTEGQGPGIGGVQPIGIQTGKSAVSALPSGQVHATPT